MYWFFKAVKNAGWGSDVIDATQFINVGSETFTQTTALIVP